MAPCYSFNKYLLKRNNCMNFAKKETKKLRQYRKIGKNYLV